MLKSQYRIHNLPKFSEPESLTLEWKQQVNTAEKMKLARSIASMANAKGGRIIVGIMEGQSSDTLPHNPMTESEAKAVCMAYQEAGKELLSPNVEFDAQPVKLPSKGKKKWIVVVNVNPASGLFCAMNVATIGKQSNEAKKVLDSGGSICPTCQLAPGEPAWRIPFRQGTLTKHIDPAHAQTTAISRINDLIENTKELIESRRAANKMKRFEDFMLNESEINIQLAELGTKDNLPGLRYTIAPARSNQGKLIFLKEESEIRWIVKVIGPAEYSYLNEDALAAYDNSPLCDGEYYYCDFFNNQWHLTKNYNGNSIAFNTAGKPIKAKIVENANEYVERKLGYKENNLEQLTSFDLDAYGRLTKQQLNIRYHCKIFEDTADKVFLRINSSPPKSVYLTNSRKALSNEDWHIEVNSLNGYGDYKFKKQFLKSLVSILNFHKIIIPKIHGWVIAQREIAKPVKGLP